MIGGWRNCTGNRVEEEGSVKSLKLTDMRLQALIDGVVGMTAVVYFTAVVNYSYRTFLISKNA